MPRILLSYRRADTDVIAGRIRDRLAGHFGDDAVFMDIDNIPYGTDFRQHIKQALAESDVLIAVVGPRWVGAVRRGRTRIQDEDDPVRVEIELALQRGMPIIPTLIGASKMPPADQLPESLKAFAFINAAPVDTGRDFHQHMDRLIRAVGQSVGTIVSNPVELRLQLSQAGPSKARKSPEHKLREWLDARGLAGYADALLAQDIDLDILSQLTDADLAAAGLPLGARKRLLQAFEALRVDPIAPIQPAQPQPQSIRAVPAATPEALDREADRRQVTDPLRRPLRIYRALRAARSRGGARVSERAVRDPRPGDHSPRRLRGRNSSAMPSWPCSARRSRTRTIRSGRSTPRSTCWRAARH